MEERQRVSRAEIKERLYRRRYLVPNAVTVGNMFCGFLSIIYASSGRFEKAAVAIIFALLLDGLDGRVARKLNATSKFGVEFDSFSDLISFGVAPGILMYNWAFKAQADEFGVLVTFIYAICAASRLARFNIMQENLKSFLGLPSPGAAGVIAAFVNYMPITEQTKPLAAVSAVVLVLTGYLMVSKIQFLSIKTLRISGLRLFARIGIATLIAVTWYDFKTGLLVLAVAYALSGPLSLLRRSKTTEKKVTELETPRPI